MDHAILDFAAFLGGLIVCIVHRRVSKWMWLVIASLAGGLSLSIVRIYLFYGHHNHGWDKDLVVLSLSRMLYAFCWALFFTGLSKVLSDNRTGIEAEKVRERIDAYDQLAEMEKDRVPSIGDDPPEAVTGVQANPGTQPDRSKEEDAS